MIPFLWELFCDLCIEEATEVQGDIRCSGIIPKKKSSLKEAEELGDRTRIDNSEDIPTGSEIP